MQTTKCCKVRGKVQGVMFRQTFIRSALKRGLSAGATNNPIDRGEVKFTLIGDEDKIESFLDEISNGKEINSWGAKVEEIEECEECSPILDYEVTTENVDNFNWTPGVEMYI